MMYNQTNFRIGNRLKPVVYSSLISMFLILSACIRNEGSLILTKSVPLESDFMPAFSSSGIMNIEGTNIIYLSDIRTYKRVDFYDPNGVEISTFDLSPAISNIGSLSKIHVFNMDSILALSQYTGKLCVVHRNGKVSSNIRLNDQFEYFPPTSSSFYENGKLYLSCSKKVSNLNNLAGIELIKYQLDIIIHGPYFVKIENLFSPQDLKYRYYLDGYYCNFTEKNSYIIENSKILISDSIGYICSIYTDTITVLNLKNERTTKHVVSSAYSNIIVPQITIENGFKNGVSGNMRTYGAINYFDFSKIQNMYYFLFLHDTPGNELGEKDRHFSVAVFDRNFNRIYEKPLNPHEYISYFYLFNQDLILIKYDENTLNIKSKKKFIYEFYTYKE